MRLYAFVVSLTMSYDNKRYRAKFQANVGKDRMDALFGPLVVGYLFFGGMGAGACCVLASMVLLVPKDYYYVTSLKTSRKYPVGTCASTHEYRRLFGIGFTAAFVSLALGAAMLLADSGTQQVIVRLVSNPTLTFLSIGSFALAATLALSLLLAVCWGVAHSPLQYRFARITSWLLLAFGIVTALYTGLLLASMTAVPFWANIWLPVLFLTSSLSCGSALVLACGCLGGAILQFGTVFHRLLMLDLAVMSVELAIAVAFMA